ncbi:unnamed protein product, partial [Brassica oleracea]
KPVVYGCPQKPYSNTTESDKRYNCFSSRTWEQLRVHKGREVEQSYLACLGVPLFLLHGWLFGIYFQHLLEY